MVYSGLAMLEGINNCLSFKRREAHRGAEGPEARGARREAKAHAL